MAKEPATVTRGQLAAVVEALGLDANKVVAINATRDRVRVIEYVTDENGERVFNGVLDSFDRRCYTLEVK